VSEPEARLGVSLGSLDGTDLVRARAALGDASVLAIAEVPFPVGERWHVSLPEVVELVILKSARREYENPRGVQQETQGDHSIGLAETSGVYLTAREVRTIRRAATGRASDFVGSVPTTSPC
jgi:hypothetical protein